MPTVVSLGISVYEYWELTLGEINQILNGAQKKAEREAQEKIMLNYMLANDISIFVNLRLNGKPVPEFYELYPQYRQAETDVEVEDKSWMIYKEQFIDFSEYHNKRRRDKEGEI